MAEPPFVALVSGVGWHVQDLLRAAGRLGLDLRPLAFATLCSGIGRDQGPEAEGVRLDRARGVLVRMMPPGTLEQVIFRMDALHRVEAAGVPVLNPPRAVEAAVDKYLSLAMLAKAGLPVPDTWCGPSARSAQRAFERFGAVVVKPLFGSEGRGLLRIDHPELARRAFATLERLGAILYVQRWIDHPGYDYRLFVLDGRVIAAMRRIAVAGEWRTNVAQGGKAEPFAPDVLMERLAERTALALGARMVGVDLLPDRDGCLWVIEANAVPGWRALAAATRVDVAVRVLEALRGSA